MRTALTFLGRALATVVVVVGAAALLAGVVVPRLGGATPYTVLTGSMAPRYPVGSLMVVRPSDDIQMGDVITYQLRSGEPTVATHRVVGVGFTHGGESRYTVKGDANEIPDPGLVQPEQIRGELWYAVPYLGYVSALMSGEQRQTLGVVFAAVLIGYAVWQVVAARKEKRAKEQANAPARVVVGRHARQEAAPEGQEA